MSLCPPYFGWLPPLAVLMVLSLPAPGQEDAAGPALRAAYLRGDKLYQQGKIAEAIKEYEKAVPLAEQLHGPDALQTAALRSNLALLYKAQGRYTQAEPLIRRALATWQARLGKDHPVVAQGLNNLAMLYQAQGRYALAEPLARRSLALFEARRGKDHLQVALALNNLALIHHGQGRYDQAEPLYRRSLEIRQARLGQDHPLVATTLNNLASLYEARGRYAEAEPLYRRSLQIRETRLGKDHPQVVTSLNNLAGLLVIRGQYAAAEPLFQRGLRLGETRLGENHPQMADLLNNLANLYKVQNRYDKAELLYQRSLRVLLATRGPEHPRVALALNNLAALYAAQGRFDQVEALLKRSLTICEARRGKDHPDVALALEGLAQFYWGQADYARAEPFHLRSLRIRETTLGKDHPSVATSLNHLAELYEDQGRFDQAEPLFLRALRIREAKLGKDHPDVATTLNNLGMLYRSQGQYARAEPLYLRSLRIWSAQLGEDHPRVAAVLHNLAGLYRDRGEYERAEPLYLRSLKINETRLGKDHLRVAPNLDQLAGLYLVQGRYEKAEPLYRRCLLIQETRQGKDHPDLAVCLLNLAALHLARGEFDEAESLMRRSLTIATTRLGRDHPEVANTLDHLANLHAARRQWEPATRAVDRARRILCGHAHRVLPALAEPEQLAFLQSRHQGGFCKALSLGLLRRIDAGNADLSAGWVLNGKAVALQALAERTLLGRDTGDAALARIARQLNDTRARLARLTFAPFQSGQGAERRRQLDRLTGEERDLSQQLGRAVGRTTRADPWVTADEVRQALRADTVLIEIARFAVRNFQARGTDSPWAAPRYAAWVIPARGQGAVRLIDLGPAERIETAVAAVRRALQAAPALGQQGERRAERDLGQPLQALSRLVLRPLLADIGQAQRWVISPDAALWLVPWAALPLPDGRYVLEKYRLSYLVSGRDLVQPQPQVKSRGALLLADPDFNLEPKTKGRVARGPSSGEKLPRFERLPGTAVEARAIAPLLGRYARQVPTVRTGNQAREETFKAVRSPRVVVLSTHGFFLEDQDQAVAPELARRESRGLKMVALERPRPRGERVRVLENPLLRCGLALAGANQRARAGPDAEDGILTGLEIVGTDLRGTELVVLSACETGLGRVNVGEGVAGLRQAFQLAGARAVVATLWQIPDQETSALMKAFFTHLAAQQGKADALRQAQLDMIKQRRARGKAAHPFYWAAFTLTGQWQ